MTQFLDQFDDAALALLSLEGNEPAFAEIMRRHREAIYRLTLAWTGDADDALDLTQECFIAAYRNLSRYDRTRALRPWLSAIALNRCRDWRRRQRLRALFIRRSDQADGEAAVAADDAPGPEAIAGDRAALSTLQEQIAALPHRLRTTLVLRTIEGLSQAETAEALGITVKAVETRLSRARAALSKKL